MKRPLLIFGSVYAAGILAAYWLEVSFWVLTVCGLGVALLTFGWERARPWLLLPLAFLAGAAIFQFHNTPFSPDELRNLLPAEPQIATLRGKLCETPSLRVFEQDQQESWRTLARIDVSALKLNHKDWQPASGRVAVTTPAAITNVFGSQIVEVTGVLAPPRIALAPGMFDYRNFLAQQGIYFQLKAGSEQDWISRSPPERPLVDRFCEWGRKKLALGLPQEDEALRLEWALTLGWKPALTEEVSEPFIRAATYHIFAVDGLRMAIVFGIFYYALRAFRVPRWLCGLVLIPLLWFYVALTGWPASAIRATVMLTIVLLGWLLKRPTDVLNSLFAAAIVILTWEPRQLFQAGFQLSFVVVFFIIVTVPVFHEWMAKLVHYEPLLPDELRPRWQLWLRGPARWLGGLAVTSLAAWLGSVPLVALYFNIITPVSTPANVPAVAICGLVLISNLTSLCFASWLPALSAIFNHAGWALMQFIRISSVWFSALPTAYSYIRAPGLLTAVLYYALLLGLLTGWLFRKRFRLAKLSVLAAALLFWSWQCFHELSTSHLTVLNSNGGLTVFYQSPGLGQKLLIDCGTTNAVRAVTKMFLRAQGVNRLPGLLLTHGDLHHVGGAQLLSELFPFEHLFISSIRFRSPTYRQLIKRFAEKSNLITTLSRGDHFGPWTVLHPEPADRFSQADDSSIVLFAQLAGTKVLLLSDLGRKGQRALLERYPNLNADIVVTGLPVQGEPVESFFLETVRPKLLIVGDSEFPVSERARPQLRERLGRSGIPVIYTRFSGAATLEFRSGDWQLGTMSGAECKKSTLPSLPAAPPEKIGDLTDDSAPGE